MQSTIRTSKHGSPLTIEPSDSSGWVFLKYENQDRIEVSALELFHAIKAQVELNKAKNK